MPKFYQFRKRDESSIEDAEKEAESLGLFDIYKIEDFNSHQMLIGGFATDVNLEHISHLKLESTSDSIDWEKQSELFSPYYKNGRVEIPLKDFAMTDTLLILTPGGGFGDMSHPTTKLALGLLEKRVHGKTVLDIGCGNGILSFAAKLLGAAFVNGIDIDSQALEHAQINRSLNCLDEIVISTIPDEKIAIAKELVCLMNMTFAEQRCAFASIKDIAIKPITLITSGILIEQRDRYLTWLKDLGFSLLQEQEQDGWMAFVLNNRGKSCESYPQL